MKKMILLTSLYKLVAHGVMLFTILATIMLFIRPQIAMALFTVGASSGFVAFGFFFSGTTPYFWGGVAFVWCHIFPILMIVSYIYVIKKEYIPFCAVVACDAFLVVMWSIYSAIDGNYFGVQTFVFDTVVSLVLAIVLVRITYQLIKEKRTVG